LLSVIVALGGFLMGFDASVISGVLKFIEPEFNLTKIESRPSKLKAFEYFFYVDFIGSQSDATIHNALTHLREFATMVKVLGSYGVVE
ncbi:MAG: hypothetical protein OQK59_06640, partial [Chlorobium sp.]|nr:hypothetical protein [Chlorobium sp.]